LGSRIVDSGSIGDQERTNPSLAWLMPKDIMWGSDEVILQSDNINVTVDNYAEVGNLLLNNTGRILFHKLFLNLNTWGQCYKTFCARNLRMFVMS